VEQQIFIRTKENWICLNPIPIIDGEHDWYIRTAVWVSKCGVWCQPVGWSYVVKKKSWKRAVPTLTQVLQSPFLNHMAPSHWIVSCSTLPGDLRTSLLPSLISFNLEMVSAMCSKMLEKLTQTVPEPQEQEQELHIRHQLWKLKDKNWYTFHWNMEPDIHESHTLVTSIPPPIVVFSIMTDIQNHSSSSWYNPHGWFSFVIDWTDI
jgi:hypothetical protein